MDVWNKDTMQDSSPSVTLTVGQLMALVREEMERTIHNGHGRCDSTGRPPEAPRPYLAVKEAADMARLAPSAIRLYIRKLELKAHQVGRRVIIKRTDLEKFSESHPHSNSFRLNDIPP